MSNFGIMSRQVLMELQYDLNRRQRLIPHLFVWIPGLPVIVGLFFAPFLVPVSGWLVLLMLVALWVTKGFFVGLADIVTAPNRHMDLVIEENGIGYLAGGERWYISLDGVIKVFKICPDVWTVYHHNGTVINIATSVITAEQVAALKAAVQQARARAENPSPVE